MGLEYLFLLLPVAALSGWWVGRRDARSVEPRDFSLFSSDYFKGLNYLLNEQPDKAIEVFVRMLEVDSETVETHFALGSLFRRRGEVDRAIRIHQNLIARPTLNRQQREQALYELGLDYMRAGLLDRAENLFVELMGEQCSYRQQAVLQLLDVYQQEKDWDKAIATAQRLEAMSDEPLAATVAQYYCELAEQARDSGEAELARKMVRRALQQDQDCVRATLLEGDLEMERGALRNAVRAYRRVEQQEPAFLVEAIGPLQEAYQQLNAIDEYLGFLQEVLARHGGMTTVLALAELIRQQQGTAEAENFLLRYLRAHPSIRGMARMVDVKLQASDGQARADLEVIKSLMDKLQEVKPIYRCSQCGFTGRSLHWLCPGCRQWNTTKPIQGIEGE